MIDAVRRAVAADIPVLLWGPPGVGKTSAIESLAAESGAHCEVLIGSTLDPTDITRLVASRGTIRECAPPWVTRIAAALKSGRGAWLFLDELSCAPPSVQAALLRVVESRAVANVSIRGCRILAAANPVDQAADGYDLSAATLNRWAHLEWSTDAEAWIAGELGGWGSPSPDLAAARAMVTGWISHNRAALLRPPDSGEEVRGWPSPRSWSRVASLGEAAPRALVAGLVGAAAAQEYLTWVEAQDLPSPQDLLTRRCSVPERGDQAYVALGSAVSHAVSHGQLPALWSLLASCRRDHALVMARRAKEACTAARIEIEITPALSEILGWLTRGNP